ncbi:sentrin-specific protease 2-like [Alca torda]
MEPHEIPQQSNGSDCGVFTCQYANYISRDKPMTFTKLLGWNFQVASAGQSRVLHAHVRYLLPVRFLLGEIHVPHFREKMVWEILHQELL